jgi:hypothetical protein
MNGLIIIIANTIGVDSRPSAISSSGIISQSGDNIITQVGLNIIIE